MRKDKNKSQKTSFVSDMRVFFRAMKINYKIDPPFFWMQILNASGNTIRSILNSLIMAIIINGVNEGKSEKTLLIYAAIVVLLNFILNLTTLFTANRRYIRKSMWTKLLNLYFNTCSENMDYKYFEDVNVKDRRRKIEKYISEWKGISNFWAWYNLVSGVVGFVSSVAVISSMLFVKSDLHTTGILHFVNTSAAFVIFMVVMILYLLFSTKSSAYDNKFWTENNNFWSKNYRKMGKMGQYPIDTKLAMDMNIYGLGRIVKSCADEYIDKGIAFEKKTRMKIAVINIFGNISYYIIRFFACLFVGLKALSGAFGIGLLILYVTTIMEFADAFSNFGYAIGNIRGNREIYDDEFEYIDMKNDMQSGTVSPDFSKKTHTVEFKNVSFMYPGCKDYQLKNINITFGLGERLAVVGMNGSGKTTFIKLLCRLYDPTEGQILLDGRDIREYSYKEYMKMFSVVFQDFKLFAFPMAENVATSNDYDAERIKSCLKEAGMAERLENMPKGIDTCIYKSFDAEGVEISGGEAQKIALARALYKNAPIMVLDEPTASLDPIAEAEIYSHFNEMVQNKTAVYISHRLSSCRFCSRIAVFDKGELVQLGSHDELLIDKDGKYSELWNAQAQYYT